MRASRFNPAVESATGLFLVLYHGALFMLLPWYIMTRDASATLMWGTFILSFVSGIGITAGYHRFFAHKTYKAQLFYELLILTAGTLATQGSVIKWSHDHRIHHQFTDTDKDPYGVNKGFWHAHWLWILKKSGEFHSAVVQDLLKNKWTAFQHRYYVPLILALNGGVLLLFGWLTGDYFGALVLTVLLRLFLTHHATFFINSAAHYWGSRPYSIEHSAVNNWLIAIFTFGEGYHNFHHVFPSDYRNGIRWYQYDIAKYLIWTLSKIGITRDLRRMSMAAINKKLIAEDKRMMTEKLRALAPAHMYAFERLITEKSEVLMQRIDHLHELYQRYRALKQSRELEPKRDMLQRMRDARKAMRREIKAWGALCNAILKMRAFAN